MPLLHCIHDLLRDVHRSDMPIRASSSLTAMLQNWQQLEQQSQPMSQEQLKKFICQHFDDPGSDMEVVDFMDCQDEVPCFLHLVKSAEIKEFGCQVSSLWKTLYRKVSNDVLTYPEKHTLLPLPHPFIIPGDRFREVYYWDSYWIILGLLACGLQTTAVGMVRNLFSLVDTFGHVPNGSRTYYTNRSQPPLLSAMVSACHAAAATDAAADELLQQALPRLLRTWAYWTSGNKSLSVTTAGAAATAGAAGEASEAGGAGAAAAADAPAGRQHRLSRYYAEWDQPRPESYREDVALAAGLPSHEARALYRELASCAESGWDFSSRWFGDGQSLSTIRTTQIIPVDLNAFLLLTARHIAAFAARLGDAATAATFTGHAEALKAAMQQLMWSEESGCWHDLVLVEQEPCPLAFQESQPAAGAPVTREAPAEGLDFCQIPDAGGVWRVDQLKRTYASNWVPLWCGCCEAGSRQAQAAVLGFKASGLIREAGVMTSLYDTQQQWDAPNAFPPLQHMIIQGLRDSGTCEGQDLAAELASTWIRTNMQAYRATGQMHEKYDATRAGLVGGGGEYRPQIGFGWTNGVLLELLRIYPDARPDQTVLPAQEARG